MLHTTTVFWENMQVPTAQLGTTIIDAPANLYGTPNVARFASEQIAAARKIELYAEGLVIGPRLATEEGRVGLR